MAFRRDRKQIVSVDAKCMPIVPEGLYRGSMPVTRMNNAESYLV